MRGSLSCPEAKVTEHIYMSKREDSGADHIKKSSNGLQTQVLIAKSEKDHSLTSAEAALMKRGSYK